MGQYMLKNMICVIRKCFIPLQMSRVPNDLIILEEIQFDFRAVTLGEVVNRLERPLRVNCLSIYSVSFLKRQAGQ
jgi:hypothetical protein